MTDDADRYQALVNLGNTEGGQVLIESLVKEVVIALDYLSNYPNMTRDELVSQLARITTARSIIRLLNTAEDQLEMVDEALEEALRA